MIESEKIFEAFGCDSKKGLEAGFECFVRYLKLFRNTLDGYRLF